MDAWSWQGWIITGLVSHMLRWFYQYLIKEYARHLGHADLLRERIDSTVGE